MAKQAPSTAFKPGKSGNPGGLTAEVKEKIRLVKEAALERCPEAIAVIADNLRDKDPRVRQAAADSLLDRGLGKASQYVEHAGNVGFFDMLALALINNGTEDGSSPEVGAPEGCSGALQ